jgi:hypothetical protein
MTYFEILFWKFAKHLILKGYGGKCETSDLDDFPDTYRTVKDVFHQGRCGACRANEIVDWIDGHIELLTGEWNTTDVVSHDELAGSRASGWNELSKDWLFNNPTCAVCGGTENLVAHHIKPVHLFPKLELERTNLLTLCDSRKYGLRCHLFFGHYGNYRLYNPDVVTDAEVWLKKITYFHNA